MNQLFDAIKSFFAPLSTAQKVLFGIMSIGLIGGLILVFSWALQPNYSILFGSLSANSAQSIVKELNKESVPYKLQNGGQTILVPHNQVYSLRLKFASEGLATSNGNSNYKGYALFDQNTLGMTDFMQRIDRKRAMEGELAKTINSISQVEYCRVHLVLEQRAPFAQNTVKPSASVFLKLKPGQTLKNSQIQGIADLIAGSVAGLKPSKVVILDQNGNRISDNIQSNSNYASTSLQLKVRENIDAYLTKKGQSMLNKVLGPGNSILRVSTDHNFSHITKDSNTIDPNSRTVISEEKRINKKNNQSSQPVSVNSKKKSQVNSVTTNSNNNQSTIQVRNYVVDKTNEHTDEPVGKLTRISASILLNYKTVVTKGKNGKTITKSVPYSSKDLKDIKSMIVGALGINFKRGDQVTITQIKFQKPTVTNYGVPGISDQMNTYDIIRWVLVALAVAVAGFLVFSVTKKFNPDKTPLLMNNPLKSVEEPSSEHLLSGETNNNDKQEDIYKEKLSEEAREHLESSSSITKEIKDYVDNNTSEATNLVRSMLADD